jgi:putative acetyltransferase
MQTLTIRVDDPSSTAACGLIAQLDAYQMSLYPQESNHLVPVAALRRPNVTFLTAWADGRIAGCGAMVNQGGDYGEIKRMFVLPEFRGLKVGRRILEELECRMRASGLTHARLETGVRQPEALRLYEGAGYRRRGPFGEYPADPLCVFLEKELVDVQGQRGTSCQ